MTRDEFLDDLKKLEADILKASMNSRALTCKSKDMKEFVRLEDLQKTMDTLAYTVNSIIRTQANIEDLRALIVKEEELA